MWCVILLPEREDYNPFDTDLFDGFDPPWSQKFPKLNAHEYSINLHGEPWGHFTLLESRLISQVESNTIFDDQEFFLFSLAEFKYKRLIINIVDVRQSNFMYPQIYLIPINFYFNSVTRALISNVVRRAFTLSFVIINQYLLFIKWLFVEF